MINISKYSQKKDHQDNKSKEVTSFCSNIELMGSFLFVGIDGIDNENDIAPVIQGMKSISNIIQSNVENLCDHTPLEKKKS